MPNSRLSMRKIKDVLRLHFERNLSARQIGNSLAVSHNTVTQYLRRARAAGLVWPLPQDLSDAELENLLFPSLPPSAVKRPEPNWANVHVERKRRSVTLLLLWEEYKAEHPDGLQYSCFCERYRAFVGKLQPSMHQIHVAGEKGFIDYAGQTLPIQDPLTGEVREAQIFVAVLGASNYTFAEATWTQSLPDWIGSHVRAFAFFGGAPHLLVPDNLRSGVNKACRYEPDINPTYDDMATHYGSAVIPARVRKPKDKAKVEVAVQIVERWILARLRNRIFLSCKRPIRPSPPWWPISTPARSRNCPAAEERPSKLWTSRRFCRCRAPLTSSPSGNRPPSTSTTMSKRMGIIIPCRAASSKNASTSGSRPPRWNASTKDSAWRLIPAPCTKAGTRP